MVFMVIERFKGGDAEAVGARFEREGRMLPHGLTFLDSWIDASGTRCFQLMETTRPELFPTWTSKWDDIVDFEIVPLVDAATFWDEVRRSRRRGEGSAPPT
jgi:uncharacterized protein DUF3303